MAVAKGDPARDRQDRNKICVAILLCNVIMFLTYSSTLICYAPCGNKIVYVTGTVLGVVFGLPLVLKFIGAITYLASTRASKTVMPQTGRESRCVILVPAYHEDYSAVHKTICSIANQRHLRLDQLLLVLIIDGACPTPADAISIDPVEYVDIERAIETQRFAALIESKATERRKGSRTQGAKARSGKKTKKTKKGNKKRFNRRRNAVVMPASPRRWVPAGTNLDSRTTRTGGLRHTSPKCSKRRNAVRPIDVGFIAARRSSQINAPRVVVGSRRADQVRVPASVWAKSKRLGGSRPSSRQSTSSYHSSHAAKPTLLSDLDDIQRSLDDVEKGNQQKLVGAQLLGAMEAMKLQRHEKLARRAAAKREIPLELLRQFDDRALVAMLNDSHAAVPVRVNAKNSDLDDMGWSTERSCLHILFEGQDELAAQAHNRISVPVRSDEGTDEETCDMVDADQYSGTFRGVPFMMIVKDANGGKRHSQLMFSSLLEMPGIATRVDTGVEEENVLRPATLREFYPNAFFVDSDTFLLDDALAQLLAYLAAKKEAMGVCGETIVSNPAASFWAKTQVWDYFINHAMSKSFETLAGMVTCLPGCFTLFRTDVLYCPEVRKAFTMTPESLHEKNLLMLGEDRYLCTLLLAAMPDKKLGYTPNAVCSTIVPETFWGLTKQRRRWVNSTIHNQWVLIKQRVLWQKHPVVMFSGLLEFIGTLCFPAGFAFCCLIVYTMAKTSPAFLSGGMLFIVAFVLVQVAITVERNVETLIIYFLYSLLALPYYCVIQPVYAWYHMDVFSWGTRGLGGHGDEADSESSNSDSEGSVSGSSSEEESNGTLVGSGAAPAVPRLAAAKGPAGAARKASFSEFIGQLTPTTFKRFYGGDEFEPVILGEDFV